MSRNLENQKLLPIKRPALTPSSTAASILLGLVAFIYFLSGMPGTLSSYRDSGDMVSAAYTWGIAHPPGYPTYTIAAKLFSLLIPFGNPAYRFNLFSAFCAALATAILFVLCRRRSNVWIAGMLSSLWAVSLAVTTLSRVSEMYTMATLFAVVILYLREKSTPYARLGAWFILGLGLGVHPTLIFLTPMLAFPLSRPSLNRWNDFLAFLSGISIFVYLPVRASFDPLVNWGNPVSWRAFWRVVTRADYGGLKLHPTESTLAWTPSGVIEQLGQFMTALAGELGWPLVGIGLWMMWHHRKRVRDWATVVLIGPAFFVLSNLPWKEATTPAILQPYLLIVTLLWMPWVAEGLYALIPLAGTHGPGVRMVGVTVLVLLSLPRKVQSFRYDFLAYDYARNLLRALPSGAVLYDPDDPTAFSIRALQLSEGRRRDVTLLAFFRTRWGYEELRRREPDLLPAFDIPNAQALQQAIWTYSAARRPFFAELPQKFEDKPSTAEGLVYRLGTQADLRRAEHVLELAVRRGPFQTMAFRDFFSKHVLGYYAAGYCNLGLAFANAKQPVKAMDYYKEALKIDPGLLAAYNNMGILAYEKQDFVEAVRLYKTALQINPAHEGLRRHLILAQSALSSKGNKN